MIEPAIKWAVTAVEVAVGMIGGGLLNLVLAQGSPTDLSEWGNMSASVVLGGLSVYLVTRTIPAIHDKHAAVVKELTDQFRAEMKEIREWYDRRDGK